MTGDRLEWDERGLEALRRKNLRSNARRFIGFKDLIASRLAPTGRLCIPGIPGMPRFHVGASLLAMAIHLKKPS
ncbi:hypothetical protein N005_13170 [Pseudomonas mediterranea CFBP 5447]|nr:hypothetical protein N005_13170 [Pseudomonas mediterranea CFBP 5447]